MKYRIIQIAALLVIMVHLSSCVSRRIRTDNRRPHHAHYHGGGRYW